MCKNLDHFHASNAAYAADFGVKGALTIPPVRKAAVLTCMDARLHPERFLGLAEGDCHVIRNAGGRASDDAIRSLVISYKLLGTEEFYVIHHTDCGMGFFDDQTMRGLLKASLETADLTAEGFKDVGQGPGSEEGEFVDWLTFKDAAEAVVTDVKRIRSHPLVPTRIPIRGFIYDVRSGRLEAVAAADKAGRAA
jgi:carbonic anhydrase